MKNIKFLLTAAFASVCLTSVAQDFSDPKFAPWGDTPEERKENMYANQFLKQNLDNRNYDAASGYLKKLLDNAPKASVNIYARGITLFRRKIALAKNDTELRNTYIDSLMLLYDLRAENFGDNKSMPRVQIYDNKARDFLNYRSDDRVGLRKMFEAAIDYAIETEGKANPETIAIYFGNICEDYANGEGDVTADDIILAYDRLSPQFDNGDEEVREQKAAFDSYFGRSGVASCENLENIFRKKLESAPEDETVLAQAVSLMSRAKCTGDFYLSTSEQYYKVKPSAETAMFLAQAFQNENNFDKATYYLNEALAVEDDPAAKEQLYVRIAVVELAARHYGPAAQAARNAQSLNPDNGYVYFVLAQCYATAATTCQGLEGQAAYWAAYDTMAKAVALLENEPETLGHAKSMLSVFRQHFPTAEECFFAELKENDRYTVKCGAASGVATTVRFR
ncbi:MAG: enzyme of heme biosynthesis [Alistipes sp.]|nr:enzyme of heme biosynthesis [Alistipes sp.]